MSSDKTYQTNTVGSIFRPISQCLEQTLQGRQGALGFPLDAIRQALTLPLSGVVRVVVPPLEALPLPCSGSVKAQAMRPLLPLSEAREEAASLQANWCTVSWPHA